MFSGLAEHNLDAKGRLTVPSRFREALDDGMYITGGLDGCLWLLDLRSWHAIRDKLPDLPVTRKSARQFMRLMLAGEEDKPDKQGRVTIPPLLRKLAGLEPGEPVIVVGMHNRLELWSRESWAAQSTVLMEESGEFAEQLSELGFHI
jgi:MraZ protein